MDTNNIFPLLLSLIAGMSTVLGGFIIFFAKLNNKGFITFSLSFSAGIMITLSLSELFPFALDTLSIEKGNFKGILFSLFFLIIGLVISLLIDSFLSEEIIIKPSSDKALFKTGFISMIALMLHNFPEGIATYISGYQNAALGISVAFAISLHNIPEGISIAIPIYYSTSSKLKAIKYTFISGMAEPLGALLTFLLLKPYINNFTLGIIFAIVAGIMLYIAFKELIPQAIATGFKRLYIFSLLLGICIIPISHIFFA